METVVFFGKMQDTIVLGMIMDALSKVTTRNPLHWRDMRALKSKSEAIEF